MRRASSKMGWLLAAAARWLDERSLGAFARRRAIPHNALSRAPASAQTATVLMRALTEPIPTSSKAMASSRAGAFHDFYQALLEKGMEPAMARLTLARKIATITLILWKEGAHFDARRLKLQAA